MNTLDHIQATVGKWLAKLSRRPLPAPTAARGRASLTADFVAACLAAAEAGRPRELLSLYRDVLLDSHVQAEFSKRALAVLGDPHQVIAFDKENAQDVAAAEAVRAMIHECENWLDGVGHLLKGALWPVVVLEKVFAPAPRGTGLRYVLRRLEPVDDAQLDLEQLSPLRLNELIAPRGLASDSLAPRRGERGDEMDAAPDIWESNVRLWPVNESGYVRQSYLDSQFLDPARHLVHRGHVLGLPDCWGGPMRSILFWWLLGTMDRAWWARFLEKFGTPFMVGRTNASDTASVTLLENAFALATRLGGLVVDHDTVIELEEANTQGGGEAFERFKLHANREISKLITGGDLSAEGKSTGLGSGVAALQGQVRQDIRQFDQARLAFTLSRQLFAQFLAINGLPGRAPKIVWGGESGEESRATADLLTGLHNAGFEPADEALAALSEKVGFTLQRKAPEPRPGLGAIAGLGATPPARLTHPSDAVARRKSAALAAAFKGSLAPVRQIVLASTSPEDAERRLAAFYADWNAERVAAVVEEALQVAAAAGAAAAAPSPRRRGGAAPD
jgi:phage gp29-like protein